MKYTKYIIALILATQITACANNNYKKTPPPCASYSASGDNHPCGPMRSINNLAWWNGSHKHYDI